MGFSRQEYWSGLQFPGPGDLPNPGIEPWLPTLQADALLSEPPGRRFIIGDWNAKVGSQEIPGVTEKFGLGVQNEAGQRLTILPRECTGHIKHPLPTTQEKTLHGHHQMVNTEIRLIIFFAANDGETLYTQQKQDREWTVAQIMSSLLPNSDLKKALPAPGGAHRACGLGTPSAQSLGVSGGRAPSKKVQRTSCLVLHCSGLQLLPTSGPSSHLPKSCTAGWGQEAARGGPRPRLLQSLCSLDLKVCLLLGLCSQAPLGFASSLISSISPPGEPALALFTYYF